MADLKNVIKGLESCITCPNQYGDCDAAKIDCPYRGIDCHVDLMRDALALLKAQEPRVLMLREWICAPEPADGECMCYEIKGQGLRSMSVKAFDGVRHLYGKAFRVWTVRPTDAQRKEVKWDE